MWFLSDRQGDKYRVGEMRKGRKSICYYLSLKVL